jgi:UDP-GlcNAc:undecaprenyl-phosphate GlcNAc-1-phosphate transferase
VIAGTKIATALMVLILPVTDALFVIGARLRAGVSIFEADERHLHYRLRTLGWGERHIVAFFILLTGTIGLLSLATVALGKFVTFLLVLTLVLSFLFWVERELGRKERVTSSV